MKAKIGALLAVTLLLGLAQTYAATTSTDTSSAAPTGTSLDANALDSTWTDATNVADATGATDTGTETNLNAATTKDTTVATPKGGIGNYVEVACDKDFFTQNGCNQCFDWGKKMAWEKITWLTDSWTNPNTAEEVIYNDEQVMPAFLNLWGGNTIWVTNPQEPEKFWKYSDEVVWTDSQTWSGKQEFLLEWGKMINFLESDLGASYTLQSTDKQEWDAVGLLKFSLNYHDIDDTAKEWDKQLHTECVAYYAWTPAPVAPVPETPKEVTKVKTGPESYALIIVALALAWVLVRLRKKA